MKKKILTLLVLLMTAVTGAWAGEETLLTTIENTGDNASFNSGSQTFDNIATVTFSGEVTNDEDWGWYSMEERTLTVTAAEGYTITRVKFYTASNSAFDEQAPFEAILVNDFGIDTKVSGTSIGSWGVNKIEVYGYADTPAAAGIDLTPSEGNTVWTLAATPAYDVELEVEYYDEVSLTDGSAITALNDYTEQEIWVNYTRSFTEGKTSTVCLPFAYTKKEGDGSFYAFTNIELEGSDYVATMTEPGTTTLEANTPYLYLPNATGTVDFSGAYTIPAELTAGSTTSNGWTFKGTFETKEWTTAPTGIYGFSAQDIDGISQGQFVKVGEYVRVKPMRAYLQYGDGTSDWAGARGMTRAAAEPLPETIKVRLISANGEVNAIGTISTKTGEGTIDSGAWYSLDGRRIEGKPSTKGIYVNNGNKVIIK